MCANLSHLIQIKAVLSNMCCFTEDNKPHKDSITETKICYKNRSGNSENMYPVLKSYFAYEMYTDLSHISVIRLYNPSLHTLTS